MSINVSVAFQIPTNVVEVGNEISTQQLSAITSGTSPSAANPFTTVSYITGLSYLTTSSASSTYQTISGMSSYLTTSSASSTYAPKASPTFTGTVTIPAGASISGYLTTSSASSTYQTISGMSGYATTSYVTSQGYLTDAPSNGSEYVRKNGAWSVATGGGGGGISDAPSDGFSYVRNSGAWTQFTGITEAPNDGYYYVRNMGSWQNITGLGFITSSALTVTNIDLTGNFNGYSMGSGWYTFKFDSSTNTLRMQDGVGSGISISATAITFPDSTTLSTAPIVAKSVNTQTNTYTLAATDANNIVYIPSGSGGGMSMSIVVPADITYNFPVGTIIMLYYDTSGGYTIDFGTTLSGSPTLVGNTGTISSGNQGMRTLTKLAADFWYIL